jgi:hypothetical protein
VVQVEPFNGTIVSTKQSEAGFYDFLFDGKTSDCPLNFEAESVRDSLQRQRQPSGRSQA